MIKITNDNIDEFLDEIKVRCDYSPDRYDFKNFIKNYNIDPNICYIPDFKNGIKVEKIEIKDIFDDRWIGDVYSTCLAIDSNKRVVTARKDYKDCTICKVEIDISKLLTNFKSYIKFDSGEENFYKIYYNIINSYRIKNTVLNFYNLPYDEYNRTNPLVDAEYYNDEGHSGHIVRIYIHRFYRNTYLDYSSRSRWGHDFSTKYFNDINETVLNLMNYVFSIKNYKFNFFGFSDLYDCISYTTNFLEVTNNLNMLDLIYDKKIEKSLNLYKFRLCWEFIPSKGSGRTEFYDKTIEAENEDEAKLKMEEICEYNTRMLWSPYVDADLEDIAPMEKLSILDGTKCKLVERNINHKFRCL